MSTPGTDPAIDAQSRVGEIVAILCLASVISTTVVSLRVFTRAYLIRSFGIDDGVMVVAQLMTLAVAVTIGIETQYGLGRHIWTMPPDHVVPYLKTFLASIVIYNFATPLVKISILLQYKRIFALPQIQKICFYALFVMIGIAIAFPMTLGLSCSPVQKFYYQDMPGNCIKYHIADPIMGGTNILTDLFLLILPMPAIKSLQLARKQKFMLAGVFALSTITIAIALYRIKPLILSTITNDPTWDNVDAATFSYLEVTTGATAASLPALRPLIVRLIPSMGDNSKNRTGYKKYDPNMPRSGKWSVDRSGRSKLTDDTLMRTLATVNGDNRDVDVNVNAKRDGAASRESSSTTNLTDEAKIREAELAALDRSHAQGISAPDEAYRVSVKGGRPSSEWSDQPRPENMGSRRITATTTVVQTHGWNA